jgi:hypothetical protein
MNYFFFGGEKKNVLLLRKKNDVPTQSTKAHRGIREESRFEVDLRLRGCADFFSSGENASFSDQLSEYDHLSITIFWKN